MRSRTHALPLILRSPQDISALSPGLPVSLTLSWGNQGSSSSLLPDGERIPLRYSRHEAQFGADLHALPLLDIVGWNDALTAHLVLGFVPVGVLGEGQPTHALRPTLLCRDPGPRGMPRGGKGWGRTCEVPDYLGDGHNGEHISLAEGKVLLSSAMEVVLGNTFCTRWPGGLQDRQQMGRCGLGPLSPHLPTNPRGPSSWLPSVGQVRCYLPQERGVLPVHLLH